jgi:hypothetical protein
VHPVHARLIAGFALAGALASGSIAALGERDYRAHAYVIRVPPAYSTKAGVALARSDRVLGRALRLAAGARPARTPGWLRRHSEVALTGRGDFAISVAAPGHDEAIALATAQAKAIKRALPAQRGLHTIGRGARRARRGPSPLAWALLGAAGGLWLGVAAAIVRSGSARAPRRASPPCAPATRATPG